MKRIDLRWAAMVALVFGLGLGTSVSALASDPGCYSACQEQLNDCIAQAGGGSTRHCGRQYRECTSACEIE